MLYKLHIKFMFRQVTELLPFITIDIINLHRLLDLRQEFTNLNTLLCNLLLIFGSSIISGISAQCMRMANLIDS